MKRNEVNKKKNRSVRVDSVFLALKHDKAAVISLILLGLIILFALIAPLLPVEPNATNIANRLQPPSAGHWFGTDEVGRDYFARVIYGGRVSLLVGFLAMLTSLTIGVAVGTISGFCGGIVDMVLMRIVDVLYSIPWMILVTVVSIFLRPGLKSIILVIGFLRKENSSFMRSFPAWASGRSLLVISYLPYFLRSLYRRPQAWPMQL